MTGSQESLAIARQFSRTAIERWRALRDVPTSLLADAHRSVRSIGTPLRAWSSPIFVGSALPVYAGSLAQWKALDLAQPGDVLAIACGSRRTQSEFGEIFVGLAKKKGVAAIVTDGLLRDAAEIEAIGLPVFACGTHPYSPADPNPGSIGCKIDFAGVEIACGDVIVGDRDGLAILPADQLDAILERTTLQAQREADLKRFVDGDGSLPPKLRERLAQIPVTEVQ